MMNPNKDWQTPEGLRASADTFERVAGRMSFAGLVAVSADLLTSALNQRRRARAMDAEADADGADYLEWMRNHGVPSTTLNPHGDRPVI